MTGPGHRSNIGTCPNARYQGPGLLDGEYVNQDGKITLDEMIGEIKALPPPRRQSSELKNRNYCVQQTLLFGSSLLILRKFVRNKDCVVPKTHLVNQNAENSSNETRIGQG